ncbi:MAG: SusE domain-containing protein, partial [Prevotella sp.]|nr:SusE domain-containing protein [Prevotella sp.]
MKKIYRSLLFLAIAAVPFLTSCKDDNDSNPTLSIPSTFVLNIPELAANNIYDLPYGKVNVTASQPDYGGWPAAVTYAIQVSLDGNNWTELPTTYPAPNMSIDGSEINDVVLPLYRAANEDQDPPSGLPVMMRSRAFLGDTSADFAEVYSNSVSINVYAWEAPQELALPTNVFVCGGSIGDAWSTWKPVPLIWTKEGQFYTMIYNNADGFKWGNKPN